MALQATVFGVIEMHVHSYLPEFSFESILTLKKISQHMVIKGSNIAVLLNTFSKSPYSAFREKYEWASGINIGTYRSRFLPAG